MCGKYVETGMQCGCCERYFYFKGEGTAKEKAMQNYLEKNAKYLKIGQNRQSRENLGN